MVAELVDWLVKSLTNDMALRITNVMNEDVKMR